MEFGDVNHWSTILMETLNSASGKQGIQFQASIFRVPESIRRTNVDSFEPKIVSLGPYHHGKQRFRATDERIKLPFANNFFMCMDVNSVLQDIVVQFENWESRLRDVYSEQISMSRDEFLKMMLLDCAFLAEFLIELGGGHRRQMEEYSWEWAAASIVNDMFVVENQIPLFPLLYLLEVAFPSLSPGTLIESVCRNLTAQIHQSLSPRSSLSPTSTSTFHSFQTSSHLLHLFHSQLVSKLKANAYVHVGDYLPSFNFPSAEVLEAMRIQFSNKTDGSSFLDITFNASQRSMEIPQLLIDDDNISLLRNLIAFEQQCHWVVRKYISTYVWFMDYLINTDKDVAVLRKNGIIVSRLRSDEEVAYIFNELRRTYASVVDSDHLYLAEVMHDVGKYCRKRSNRLWALWNFSWLRQNYFKNRWATIGVAAVIFFNLLTLVQTVYAILSYAKQ